MIWRYQSNSSTYDWFLAQNHTFRAFWAYFEPKWANSGKTRFFGKNWTRSLLTPYSALTSCKKSEKSLEPFSSNMGITLLLGPFWAIRPLKYNKSANSGKTRFFGKIMAAALLTLYSALTSCKKSEKSLEPFSSNMGITLLLGPFWAIRPLKYHISAHFGKTGFFPKKRPCTFLALIVVNFHAKY